MVAGESPRLCGDCVGLFAAANKISACGPRIAQYMGVIVPCHDGPRAASQHSDDYSYRRLPVSGGLGALLHQRHHFPLTFFKRESGDHARFYRGLNIENFEMFVDVGAATFPT